MIFNKKAQDDEEGRYGTLAAVLIVVALIIITIIWMMRDGNPLASAKNTFKALFGYTDNPEKNLADFKAELNACYSTFARDAAKTDCGEFKIKGPFEEKDLNNADFTVSLTSVEWTSKDATGKTCLKGSASQANIALVNC
jgi:hypothetical protein